MGCQQVTDRELIAAIAKHKGFIQYAADELGCSRELFYQRAKVSPEIKAAIVESRERQREGLLQVAEAGIESLARGAGQFGDPHFGACELIVSRQGRDRGWAPEKQGSNSSVTISFEVQHIIPEAIEPDYLLLHGDAADADSEDDASSTLSDIVPGAPPTSTAEPGEPAPAVTGPPSLTD